MQRKAIILILILSVLMISGCKKADENNDKSQAAGSKEISGKIADNPKNQDPGEKESTPSVEIEKTNEEREIETDWTLFSQEQVEIFDLFQKVWRLEEDPAYSVQFTHKSQITGLGDSGYLSYADISVLEISVEKKHIIIKGIEIPELPEGETHQEEFVSKLILSEDHQKLTYIYDYQGDEIESIWYLK